MKSRCCFDQKRFNNILHRHNVSAIATPRRSVAQSGSASGLGPEGRKFESCRSDHFQNFNPLPLCIRRDTNSSWRLTSNPFSNTMIGCSASA
jgi:hypothetical protein